MADFELLGTSSDETRILIDRKTGYSVALAGHPTLAAVPNGDPKYGAIVTLGDVPAEHGFRIDEVPSSMGAQALAVAFATAYASSRAEKPAPTIHIAPKYLPTGAEGGAYVSYRLKEEDGQPIEQVWVATKPTASGVLALYHTTRTDLDKLNTIKWLHLRSTSMEQHRWSESDAPRKPIWPASKMALPSARLELTDVEKAEAEAKLRDLPPLDSATLDRLIPFFASVARTDDPPAFELIPKILELRWNQISMQFEPAIAEVLLRTLPRCKTALDLRAWAWQCVWAVGNR